MAAGNQGEKGICALFVMAARTTNGMIIVVMGVKNMRVIVQWPWFRSSAIEISNKTSPMRFIRAVIIPAARDLGFWK
jgi:hypothetical protein